MYPQHPLLLATSSSLTSRILSNWDVTSAVVVVITDVEKGALIWSIVLVVREAVGEL